MQWGAPARALMPSGTASNEALHAEIISWGTSIRSLHKSTLRLKLCIMHFGKLLAHHVASCYPGIRQTSEAVLLARALANNVWTENIWENWCLEQGGRAKAAVPLHRSRQKERQQVREWKATHGKKHTHVQKKHVKRTVHAVPRMHSVRPAGYNCSLQRRNIKRRAQPSCKYMLALMQTKKRSSAFCRSLIIAI